METLLGQVTRLSEAVEGLTVAIKLAHSAVGDGPPATATATDTTVKKEEVKPPPQPDKKPKADAKPAKVTKDTVIAALRAYIDAQNKQDAQSGETPSGKDKAVAVLKEHAEGANNMTECKPEHFEAAQVALEKALADIIPF